MEKTQFYSYLKDANALNAETLEETKQITTDFPWFQAGWLLYLKNLKNQDCPEYSETLKNVAVRIADRKILFKYLNSKLQHPKTTPFETKPPIYKLEEEGEPENKNSLIDKFLSSEKRGLLKTTEQTGEQEEHHESEEILERSSTTDDEMVTEMLASIYFQQKKYDEALTAYEKLCLKYPEKSVYFAARAKEIEKIKNNN